VSNVIRIKRRAAGGASGAPATMQNAELAYNEAEDVLYYGKGTGGTGGSASAAVPIAGPGAFAQKDSPEFTGTPAAPTPPADNNSTRLATTAFVIGQAGGTAPLAPGSASAGSSAKFAREDHRHPTDTTRAPLNSPAFTGTPTAPTAASSTNTTQIATTAFVKAVIAELIGSASSTLDTIEELAAALENNPDVISDLTALVGEKLAKASNLADLPDKAAARTNLQLGNMSLQAANNVAITGGSINGVDLDGGTF
jgi:hypothetical protein